MDVHQLKTFVAVAREGSITRAAERVHLSQPAVSAHIRAIEEAVGLTLFERTARGMTLTREGQGLLPKAEAALAAHDALLEEARRLSGAVSGKLRLAAGNAAADTWVRRLVTAVSTRYPDAEISLSHATSTDVLAALLGGSLDAGIYNEDGEPDAALATHELTRFHVHVAAPSALGLKHAESDLRALAAHPWIYPAGSSCCGRYAERLFEVHRFRPPRIVSVDRGEMTRSLVAAGAGVGLLHTDAAEEARAKGEVDIVHTSTAPVRVLFAHLARRADDPLIRAALSILREG